MNRRAPSRTALVVSAAVVFVVLIALVVLPVALTTRMDRLRKDVQTISQPARNDLNQVNEQLSHQIASLSRFALTNDPRYLAGYRQGIAAQEKAMGALAAHVPALGQTCVARFADLQTESDRWHGAVDTFLQKSQTNHPAAEHQIIYQANYPSVVEAVSRLDEAISSYQAAARNEVQRITRIHLIASAILVLLALAAALIVVWLVARLRTLTENVAQESERRLAALHSRDEILGIVSHDLRSPLTTIILSTQLLDGAPSEEQSDHVETILSTTRRMQRLIQDLLDITKMEGSSLSIRHDDIDAAEIANEVVAGHAPVAAQKQIQFVPSIDSDLPHVCGDHDRLVQALGNLLGNALKFTPEAGTIRFTAQRSDGKVRFAVIDSGPGIAPSDLPHLFEPFWQSKKTAHLGAGLGLKITRAIIEAHGGSIQVSNEPGGGVCFSFDVPAARRPTT